MARAAGGVKPPTGTDVEFDIQEEHWNEYEVEQGRVQVRARAILTRLTEVGPNQYGANAQFIITARALNGGLKGEPSTDPIQPGDRRYQVDFEPMAEPWNIYRTRGPNPRVLRTRLVVSGIERIADKFDNLGEPVYFVAHQLVVAPPMEDKNPVKK